MVHPDGNHGHPLDIDAHLGVDVVARRLRDGDDGRQSTRHAGLHTHEPEPTPRGDPLPRPRSVGQRQLAVDGDGVVHGDEQRPTVGHHAQQSGPEALIVVDDVELPTSRCQHPTSPQREGQRLAESRRAHDRELEGTLGVGELPRVGNPKGVGVAVEVEPGNRREADSLVENRPGWAGEHLHRVPELDQLPREVPGVDPLSPALGIAPVDEEGDASAAGPGRGGGHAGRGDDLEAASP